MKCTAHLCSHDNQTAVATAIISTNPATPRVRMGRASARVAPLDARREGSFAPIADSAEGEINQQPYELACCMATATKEKS
jgi:hypothetical protein